MKFKTQILSALMAVFCFGSACAANPEAPKTSWFSWVKPAEWAGTMGDVAKNAVKLVGEHPRKATGVVLGGAVVVGLVGYGLYKWFTRKTTAKEAQGGREQDSQETAQCPMGIKFGTCNNWVKKGAKSCSEPVCIEKSKTQ